MNQSIQSILVLVCVAVLIGESNARHFHRSEVFAISADCTTDDELLDLCQRCAKLTKSNKALPACCSTDIEARKWCSDYVYFGRGEYDFIGD